MAKKLKWNLLPKNDFIDTVKFIYQHPGGSVFINYEEYVVDYETTNWRYLFSKYNSKDWINTEKEKLFFDKLPEKITVYRCCTSENENGISWTTNKTIANWFTTSFYYENKDCKILEKEINKSDINAVLLDMDEDEIILL